MLVSPGLADDFDAVAVLREAVDECDDAGSAGERVAPLLEGEVGGDDRRALLVASADDAVEDVRGAGIAGQVAELVKDKQIGARVAAETTLEGGQRFLAEKIGERRGEGREPDGEAGRQCGLREILRDRRLAETGAALQQDILSAVDEVELDETLDEWALDLLGVCPAVDSALLGVGTAMVYPTLLAAIGDVAHPSWRASSVGIYRLGRDLGYAVGAVIAGITAQAFGIRAAIWVVAAVTFASGVVVAVRMRETLGRKPPPSADCISPEELATRSHRGEPLAIVDVRSREEFSEAHVDGAINIPMDQLPDEIDRLRATGAAITVCGKGGGRSATAAQLLRDRGIGHLWWLCGGTTGWTERTLQGARP